MVNDSRRGPLMRRCRRRFTADEEGDKKVVSIVARSTSERVKERASAKRLLSARIPLVAVATVVADVVALLGALLGRLAW